MKSKLLIAFSFIIGTVGLSGCAPLIIAGAGAATAVAVDNLAEQDGDEGLF